MVIRNSKLSADVKSSLNLKTFGKFGFLTKGRHGSVWLSKVVSGFPLENHKTVVVKQVQVSDKQGFRPQDVYKERDIMIFLQHSSVCKLLGAFSFLDSSFFVMEACQGNNVFKFKCFTKCFCVLWLITE